MIEYVPGEQDETQMQGRFARHRSSLGVTTPTEAAAATDVPDSDSHAPVQALWPSAWDAAPDGREETPAAPPVARWRPVSTVGPGLDQAGRVVLKERGVYFKAAILGLVVAMVPATGLGAILGPKDTADVIVGACFLAVGVPATAWIVYRCVTARIVVDRVGLQVRNLVRSRAVPWSAVQDISTRICRGGEGGSSVSVVIVRRDGGRSVPITAMSSMSFWGTPSSRAQERAAANAARLRSLCPPGSGLNEASAERGPDVPPGQAAKARQHQTVVAFVVLAVVALAAVAIIAVKGPAPDATLGRYLRGSGGTDFTARDAHFRARFPTQPSPLNPTSDPSGVVTYVSASGSRSFAVFAVPVVAGAADDLEADAKLLLVGGTALSTRHETFRGYAAIDIVISSSAPQGFFEATVFTTATDTYSLIVSGPENPPKGYQIFIQSFQLTG